MTYHPRFQVASSRRVASVELAERIAQRLEQPPCSSELSLAQERLAQLFPAESFAPACIVADRRTGIGLLAAFAAIVAVIVVRSIM